MIFRQLFETESSTYTYLIADPQTRRAVLVDPVVETVERDLAMLQSLDLTLAATLDTHIHADHVTSACRLRSLTGSKIAHPAIDDLPCADIPVSEDRPFTLDGIRLDALHTPGHTDTHHCYLLEGQDSSRAFTGDALLIDGCGRTDFQGGSSEKLWASVRGRLFTLPGDTLVHPAHDYKGRWVSSIAQERERNPRLGGDRTLDQFVKIMAELDLPYPKKMDAAVPANMRCGGCTDAEIAEIQALRGVSVQG